MEKEQIRETLRNPGTPSPSIDGLQEDSNEKRVGVYLRVAARTVNAVQTIEVLTQHYRDFVEIQPGWMLYKIYMDEGPANCRSGQVAFQEMMDDARQHRIDLVVAQGLSRFAGSISTAIDTIRGLASLNPSVGVYIESENIYSLNPGSMFLLDIIQAVAAEEARNKSRAMRFSTFS